MVYEKRYIKEYIFNFLIVFSCFIILPFWALWGETFSKMRYLVLLNSP